MKKQLISIVVCGALVCSSIIGTVEGKVSSLSTIQGQVRRTSSYNQLVDSGLDPSELKVAGLPLGLTLAQVETSLGKPTEVLKTNGGNYIVGYRYGGIKFLRFRGGEKIGLIVITNRDAVTSRGIGVGDTLEDVYATYGHPLTVEERTDRNGKSIPEWFYGKCVYGTDIMLGIIFKHDGEKVIEINYIDN